MTFETAKSYVETLDLKWDDQGLIPAVVQDGNLGKVLMMAYMNRESLAISLAEDRTCFWSRSRQVLWRKGETSGHRQRIQSIHMDCDRDTLLVAVEQTGAACHNGTFTCFTQSIETIKK